MNGRMNAQLSGHHDDDLLHRAAGARNRITEAPAEVVLRLPEADHRLVDVRDEEKYDHGHLAGAVNLPLGSAL